MKTVAPLLGACTLLACWAAVAGEPSTETLLPAELVGVWEQCYEPGFPGISEIDQGFLVFEPRGRYKRIWQGQDSPVIVESGRYEVTGNVVTVMPETRVRPNGEPGGGHVFTPRSLKLLRMHAVEFWRNRGKVVDANVLTSSGNANYAYARVL